MFVLCFFITFILLSKMPNTFTHFMIYLNQFLHGYKEKQIMKKLRILWGILKRTRADHILLGFVLFLLADAAVIRLVEPDIHRYGDALWYCYAVISTAGFGDIVTVTLIGKICSVLLTIYTIFVVAIVTGVVVNFYTQLVEMQQKETLAMFMDKLERLRSFQKRNWNISRRKSANSVKKYPLSICIPVCIIEIHTDNGCFFHYTSFPSFFTHLLPTAAAINIHINIFTGKHRNKSMVTASGFFIIPPRSVDVTIAAANTT